MISDSRHADELLTAERIADDGTRNDATGERVRLRAIRLPRRLMYRRGDLEEFIAALQPPAETERVRRRDVAGREAAR